jgi:glycopeptide antibiotics resistance protein
MGAGISLSIEVLQLFLRRGYSELDDVMHNTLGCLIGYGLYFIIRIAYEKISKRRVAVL